MDCCLCAALLVVWCEVVLSDPSCGQIQFLHRNGSCVECPACGPGEQLSEDCGFGDGGEGLCVACGEGRFSDETGVAPCKRCTRCNLLNRLQGAGCTESEDTLCGPCLQGYYELRGTAGEIEPSCVPCYNMGKVHKKCLRLKPQASRAEIVVTTSTAYVNEPTLKKSHSRTFSMLLIGSMTAASTLFIILMFWTFLMALERLKQTPGYSPGPRGLFSGADQAGPPLSHLFRPKEASTRPPEAQTQSTAAAEETPRGLSSPSQENELQSASIVINVTTNIQPSSENAEAVVGEELGVDSHYTKEMEENLQKIWDAAKGQGLEALDYDTVHDLSLLMGPASHRGGTLRRLARSLGVPPQILTHLRGFPDLFQYLRTSTYLLLPQLAQAAALLPSPGIVARIHQAVVNE